VLRGFPSHLDLTVSDLAASIRFYDALLPRLGYRRLDPFGGGAPCWGERSRRRLLQHRPRRSALGRPGESRSLHAGVPSRGVPRRRPRGGGGAPRVLLGIGAIILDPPAEYDYTAGYYAVFFADPDGLKLEVVFEPRLRGRTG
jgi:catechol 2,3-dioxygenase-like lactoylglutathione lyase family enzyme